MLVTAAHHEGLHLLEIVAVHALRISENLGHVLRHNDLVYGAVRIRGNDRAAGVIDSLSKQVLAESPFLTFQSLLVGLFTLVVLLHFEGHACCL